MRIFYHHIPRTGGTTISKIAEKNYGRDIFFYTANMDTNHFLNFIQEKERLFIFCDSLSVDSNIIKKIIKFCDFDFISVRNPISRFESLYNFWEDNNPNDPHYNIGDKKLCINDFYLRCKYKNKKIFLNLQHEYLNLYHPKKIINLDNFEESLKDLKVFDALEKQDLCALNSSKNNYKLSEELREDYKINFSEDFIII